MVSFDELKLGRKRVAVVGLGYVGLPLAVELSAHFPVFGFDISAPRIAELRAGHDHTREVDAARLSAAHIDYTSDPRDLALAGVIIVAVPTPIDRNRKPDLSPVRSASELVGRHMSRDCVVVYESTVYPGVTEEFCVPILEKESGLLFGTDFTVGYSPERINPGDKKHTLATVMKIVSGSDAATAELLEKVYGSVVTAGIHKASTIKVAEAAKVIENTQRDLNIALMNELSLIFDLLGIDTKEVLDAAGTKWNFLHFYPGLVGGHCIGVDPYYLTFRAEAEGYTPQIILAGRRINDSMGQYVAQNAVKKMIREGCKVKGARVGILGLTFKENVPDLRNSKVADIIHELESYEVEVLVHDPEADSSEAMHEYGIETVPMSALSECSAVILAVPHAAFVTLTPERLRLVFRKDMERPVLIDVKGVLDKAAFEADGFDYWRL